MTQICIRALTDSNKCTIWWLCWSVKRICLLQASPMNQFWRLLLQMTDKTPEHQTGLAKQRWMNLGHVTRWDANLSSSSWGSVRLNTTKKRTHPEDRTLWAHAVGEGQQKQDRSVEEDGCSIRQRDAFQERSLGPYASLFHSISAPCTHPVNTKVTPQQLLLQLSPLPQIFSIRRACDRGWHFICLFPINSSSSHLHLKPPQLLKRCALQARAELEIHWDLGWAGSDCVWSSYVQV